MIVKSRGQKGSNSAARLLEYVTRPDAIVLDKHQRPLFIKHHIFGESIKDFERAFLENVAGRRHARKDMNYLFHEFIAFHPNDTKYLNNDVMEDLIRKYLELRCENGIALAVIHGNSQSRHSHLLIGPNLMDGSGRSLRITQEKFQSVKEELQAYALQKYPPMISSIIDFEKQSLEILTDQERAMKKRTGGALTRKEEIAAKLETAFELSMSREEFFHMVQEVEGLKTYRRGDKVVGIEDLRKFRFRTLGYSEAKLADLDKRNERMQSLADLGLNAELEQIQKKESPWVQTEDEEEINEIKDQELLIIRWTKSKCQNN